MRLETARLILRPWEARDRAPYAALNADVIDFPRPMTREESDGEVDHYEACWALDGFGFAAIERKADGALLGMAGLARCDIAAPVAPCVEIAWRLARAHWGQGYATEAARAWLAWGLGPGGLEEIVAFTDRGHAASIAVMRRAGMVPDPARDFRHPDVAPDHPMTEHVVCIAARGRWPAP